MIITKYFNFLSLRYISNLSILGLLLSYYMNAFDVFFIFIPLVIVNFIIIHIIEIWNYDDFINGVLDKIYPDKKERYDYAPKFIFINLGHLNFLEKKIVKYKNFYSTVIKRSNRVKYTVVKQYSQTVGNKTTKATPLTPHTDT